MRAAFPHLFLQYRNFGVLASQAQNRGPGNVRVADVSRQQPAQRARIVAGAAATHFMRKKFHAIQIWKESGISLYIGNFSRLVILDFLRAAFPVRLRQPRNVLVVSVRRRVPPALSQTPAAAPKYCCSRKKPAAPPASNFACPHARPSGETPQTYALSTLSHPAPARRMPRLFLKCRAAMTRIFGANRCAARDRRHRFRPPPSRTSPLHDPAQNLPAQIYVWRQR